MNDPCDLCDFFREKHTQIEEVLLVMRIIMILATIVCFILLNIKRGVDGNNKLLSCKYQCKTNFDLCIYSLTVDRHTFLFLRQCRKVKKECKRACQAEEDRLCWVTCRMTFNSCFVPSRTIVQVTDCIKYKSRTCSIQCYNQRRRRK